MNNVNKQKKILLLGGLRYLLPVIKAAHDLGYYVITCDYLPDNIADLPVNISLHIYQNPCIRSATDIQYKLSLL